MKILKKYVPEIILLIFFGVFLIVNKGITVGDRDNHKPGFHLAQLCYLFSILTIFSFNIEKGKSFLKVSNIFKFFYLLPLIAIIILKFYYAHPFLISDNTHYVFYV